jgi:outer membrane lipoprotein-sorting protein
MKTFFDKTLLILPAACLCTALLLTGCGRAGGSPANPSGYRDGGSRNGNTSGVAPGKNAPDGGSPGSSASKASKKIDNQFASAFKTVESNSLYDSIQVELWLSARSAIQNEASGADRSGSGGASGSSGPAASAGSSKMKELSDIRAGLVKRKGVHYTEVVSMTGFDVTYEYWIRDGKFKKAEADKVTIYDGKSYIQYDPAEKTGTRYDKDVNSGEVSLILNSMLPSLANSPYEQKEDVNINGFDCNVFYMDMEIMGMKGNTLYIDKKTGMLIKYAVGDEKEGISNTITKFETGGFDGSVFKIPAGIKLEDSK